MRSRTLAIVTALLAAFLSRQLEAQTGSLRASFSSPTAASLGKFGDIPVSLYTGVPDVSIPLFTVRGRTLELPIVLRYHGGGVRVEEHASWVGLGWALDAGGTITRTVRGLVDETFSGYYHTGHVFFNSANWPTVPGAIINNIIDGLQDSEPDEFFFNFAGRSGKFVIGPTDASGTKEVRTLPYQKLRIEPIGVATGSITSFVVTTEDGTQYTFAAAESTQNLTLGLDGSFPPNYGEVFTSSWHLTKIRAMGGDSIMLSYTPYQTEYQHTAYMEQMSWALGGYCPANLNPVMHARQGIAAQRLTTIESSQHRVTFTADAALRLDALSPYGTQQERRLDLITVSTPAGTVLRHFKLNHDYFSGTRLRLTSVAERDASGGELPPWTFTYQPGTLPPTNSYSQDHWGFHNGKYNTTLIPAGVHQGYSFPGADREPSPNDMKVATLTRLTYPTGGYTEFEWQPHDYYHQGLSGWGPVKTGYVTSYGGGYNTAQLVIGGTPGVAIPVTITTQVDPDSGCQPWEILDCTQYGELVGYGVARTYTVETYSLYPGTYTIAAYTDQPNGYVGVNASWREWGTLGKKGAGGLRLAEMRTYDAMGGPAQVKKYLYTLHSDTTRSSGRVTAEPTYHYSYGAPGCSYFSRSSTSKMPLGGGAPVQYTEVTVLHGANGEFGRTRETFRWIADDMPLISAWPYSRRTSNEWQRGAKLESVQQNSLGQNQLREAQQHAFNWVHPTASRRFPGISLQTFSGGYFPNPGSYENYVYNPFEVYSGWTYLQSDSTYHYNENGTASFVAVRQYGYDNAVHAQLTSVAETNSDGRQRITRFRYPADYASGWGNVEAVAVSALHGSVHNHSAVIERYVAEVVGGVEKIIEGELTTYAQYGASQYLPYQRFTLRADDPVSGFAPSYVSGSFARDWRYSLIEHAVSYDSWGRVTALDDGRGKRTSFAYGSYPDLLRTITRQHDSGGANLVTQVSYHADGNISDVTENGATRSFTYDGFGRLTQVRNHAGQLVEQYAYAYSRTTPGWTFNPATPNSITTTTYLQHSPLQTVVKREYLDGLGRSIQSHVQDGASAMISATQYDGMGRVWRTWRPYPRTGTTYDASFASNATSHYNAYHGSGSSVPYRQTTYTSDPLSRVKTEVHPTLGQASTVTMTYGVDAPARHRYVEVTDESGNRTRTFRDVFDNEVRTVRGPNLGSPSSAVLSFNVMGRRIQLTDPRSLVTTYNVDTRGMLRSRVSPDAGTTAYKYDQDGNLRFSQDAVQINLGQVAFQTYDFAARPLVSGVGAATFAGLNPDVPAGYESVQAHWHTVRAYDVKPSTAGYPWSLFAGEINAIVLQNTAGRLAAVASRSGDAWQVTLYSYDADGRVGLTRTFTQANGGGSVLTALNTTTWFYYDLRGELLRRDVIVGSTAFYHWYDYDNRGLLWKVFAATTFTKPGSADVTYTYRPDSTLWTRQYLGEAQVTLGYTIRGQLSRIGTLASGSEPFAAQYSYNPNGTIQVAEFRSSGSPATHKRYRYTFGYDGKNQLASAQYAYFSGSSYISSNAFSLTGINYDLSGNLSTLNRYRENATLIDAATYTTAGVSNRLVSITDNVGSTPEPWDIQTGSFTYDARGRMVTAPAPYGITSTTYDHQDLPTAITSNGQSTAYRYNEDGQRITKQVGAGSTEAYVLAGRTVLGVFSLNGAGTPVSWHYNVTAGGRVIGRQPAGAARRYYHTDLVGSTRAVTQNGAVVESYDYDPWGVLMPGRTLAGATKERFTGKERDAETGLDYFGFRYYMSAVGRWSTVDPPADSFPSWSPYNYVVNNPLTFTDPFGLWPIVPVALVVLELGSTAFDIYQTYKAYKRSPSEGAEALHATIVGGIAPGPGNAYRQGFKTFDAFKRNAGRAGDNMDWHHIVEQRPGNVQRFGAEAIHNYDNLIRVDRNVHQSISAYYSSRQPFTEGMTVRDWLSTQTFDEQRAFGRQVLQRFGIEVR